MASTGPVDPQLNGVASMSRPESPASVNSSTKRKRDASDDGIPDPDRNPRGALKPLVNGVHKPRDEKPLIRDLFDALKTIEPPSTALLKRPLPDPSHEGEPSTKKPKSDDDTKPTTIADKISDDAYADVEELFHDLNQVTKARLQELEAVAPGAHPSSNDDAIAKVVNFKGKAYELWRREIAYPNVPRVSTKLSLRDAPTSASGGVVLTMTGAAPTPRPLFTSLQHTSGPDGTLKTIPVDKLPHGVTMTRILPEATAGSEKNGRSLTLGELFPSPRNLPPLQPPKAPKNTTKGNVLGFYNPELTEKSKYRSGTYFSQPLSAGHWLDYSHATPTTHAKTKQRERAQSLAGHKPSSTELEMSEMEALFRGAFSSFAPSKDDSAAMISSRQVGRVWWTRVGHRNFDKLVEAEIAEDNEEGDVFDPAIGADFDEERVKEIIDTWDDDMVDPSLEEVLGKKSDEESDIDTLLDEISDLIDTLASYQRNRNLALPTSQDRYSADPVNGDMLRNGSLSHQPSEEEMLTYETLKAQLTLIIKGLPPYAVARLNSDKLAELAVSTKIEIRTDEYKGVMEEDEPARLARQAAQAAASNTQRQQHRVSNAGAPNQYPVQQYPGHFAPNPRPIANAQHFPQTPVRPQVPPPYQQRPPSTVPIPQPQYTSHQRPQPATQYRPQTFAPQLAKAQTPYGHSNMQPYNATPTQPRMQQHPGNYMAPAPGPANRYPPGYQGGYQQPHQQPHQPIHPQHMQIPQHQNNMQHSGHSPRPIQAQHVQMAPHPQQHMQHPPSQPYSPYANGQQLPRTMSPQVAPAHGYNHTPTPPQQHQQLRQGSYGSPAMQPGSMQQRPYGGGTPQPNQMQQGGRPSGLTGYATVMPEGQHRQIMEQARARAEAENRAMGHMGKVAQGEISGLAGIGLGGTYDVNKIAAAKMQMGNTMSPSPRMQMQQQPMNGMQGPGSMPQHVMPSPVQRQMQQQHGGQMPQQQQGFKPPTAPAPA
ncbi:hypothetical protein QBC39DRAFT_96980 [Podospora conica]|nr:hypothetical protein QBC39DRAFT_96980 [Schizothecium conicum]